MRVENASNDGKKSFEPGTHVALSENYGRYPLSKLPKTWLPRGTTLLPVLHLLVRPSYF